MTGVGATDHRGFEHRYTLHKEMKIDFDEKICLYRNCKHRVKEHNGKNCKCKHLITDIDGIGFTPSVVIISLDR